MCCCISGEPIEDPKGKTKTYETANKFQVSMVRWRFLEYKNTSHHKLIMIDGSSFCGHMEKHGMVLWAIHSFYLWMYSSMSRNIR
jgi:hypothetical protein